MTRLAILSDAERRRFDQPPVFSNAQRRLHFDVTPEARLALARIEIATNKAGYLLQLGYFRASARFFPATSFQKRDIDYVRRVEGRKNPIWTVVSAVMRCYTPY